MTSVEHAFPSLVLGHGSVLRHLSETLLCILIKELIWRGVRDGLKRLFQLGFSQTHALVHMKS